MVLSNHRDPVGGGIMTPEDACAPIPGTLIKLRILRWEDYSGLSKWTHCNHKDPYKREAESGMWPRKQSKSRREIKDVTQLAVKVEQGHGHGMQVASGNLKRQRKGFSPGASLGRCLANIPLLAQFY
ncbi:hypothetical protein HJG60_008001 [Phyllostomus discolor]|uniref:Uncharacterized protein n=1 Tax=Phyllostomus discolor TaxID=89673 RepID=A0A834EYF1_9CHIR|nr:hypothetical protein HJG60_008001 [Phyllostomus discolor]